jgi:hypothetical protein
MNELEHIALLAITPTWVARCANKTACKAKGDALCRPCGSGRHAADRLTPEQRKDVAAFIVANPKHTYADISVEWMVDESTVARIAAEHAVGRGARSQANYAGEMT